jgi:hypothetical protein
VPWGGCRGNYVTIVTRCGLCIGGVESSRCTIIESIWVVCTIVIWHVPISSTRIDLKMAVSWVVGPCRLVWAYQRFGGSTVLWNIVDSCQTTRRYNPEDSHLHTHLRENLKSRKNQVPAHCWSCALRLYEDVHAVQTTAFLFSWSYTSVAFVHLLQYRLIMM